MDTIPVIMGMMSCDSMNNCFFLFHNQSLRNNLHTGAIVTKLTKKALKPSLKMKLLALEGIVKNRLNR